jgi:hypothetical protein
MAIPLAMAIGTLTRTSRAQSASEVATAQVLFKEGVSLLDAGRFAQACPKLEAAQRIVTGIGTGLYLGECYERTGRPADAWQQFDRARELAEGHGDKRDAVARERAARLWTKLPKLTLVVSPAADIAGLVLTDDGVPVDRSAYNVERPVRAGTHHFHAFATDHEPWDVSTEVPNGPSSVRVEVPTLSEPGGAKPVNAAARAPTPGEPTSPVAASPSPSASPSTAVPVAATPSQAAQSGGLSVRKVSAIGLFGVGAAGVVAGVVFGLQAKSKMDDSNASGHCQPDNHCDAAGLTERGQALDEATLATIGILGGFAGMIGGAALYLTAPDEHGASIALVPRPQSGGAGVEIRARW